MVRHSKNNTASSVFTYAERKMTEYGTQRRRLGHDAKRSFDTCYLCLRTARAPIMLCTQGHVSCRECVLAGILEQKQAIARAEQRLEKQQQKDAAERQQQQRARDEREIDSHERRQVGLRDKRPGDGEPHDGKRARLLAGPRPAGGSEKKALTSFWIPSMAPTAAAAAKAPAPSVQCLAGAEAHPLRLKELVEVRFRTAANGDRLCPSCDRALRNSSKVDVLAPCGHAICHRCVSTFVLGSGACFVCQHKVSAKDVIRIDSEGTGFAAAGGQMVATRYDSALQA
ncbi:hypothetical protein IWQ56_004728 [Coemansia nantahalensis]|uniref:Uncharacterized protein n=2 Tax=Coemansia TaxID=4863 RepID=A0ACC1LG82_9FUNG|nr:hypothetical protein IWQ57_006543 [Coemansia nantahalensis]KAJ2763783.1 hypothetical protein IWQ56_004728 [Coemansia nantahalensis]KAJ2807859.1 hypothetical protein H4R21_000312 [Coemansia helicoidea]